MAVVSKNPLQKQAQKRMMEILDEVFEEMHQWTLSQLPKYIAIYEEDMEINTNAQRKSAKELNSEDVEALLKKLKTQDEQMKSMEQTHENGIMKVDLSEVKGQISFIPALKFREFAKFLPEITYMWGESLNKELKDHNERLLRECKDTQDFVEFITQYSDLDNTFEK